jgi:hypothetical protein
MSFFACLVPLGCAAMALLLKSESRPLQPKRIGWGPDPQFKMEYNLCALRSD